MSLPPDVCLCYFGFRLHLHRLICYQILQLTVVDIFTPTPV